jgi:hypothetical protein
MVAVEACITNVDGNSLLGDFEWVTQPFQLSDTAALLDPKASSYLPLSDFQIHIGRIR